MDPSPTPGDNCPAPLPPWGFGVGVAMGVLGSIGINVGQNIQAGGIAKLSPSERSKPFRSKMWRVGLLIFIAFSMLNFAAFALAPASVLTPLESLQFVTNIAYSKLINKAQVSARMTFGVLLALVGTVLSVVFGAQGGSCETLAQLEANWLNWAWAVYLGISIVIAVASVATYCVYRRRLREAKQGQRAEPSRHELVLPITYTLSAALLGGAQMIVHSKVLSELLAMSFEGNTSIFTSYFFYMELGLTVIFGIVWVVKLTECLGLFNPLLILPLMVRLPTPSTAARTQGCPRCLI